ncbi:hypothetical protein GLYMA_02G306150v4 [Glycine max]|nr:hypothetical protein GLYMA_02G306150v4 [Glycine max]
MLCPFFICRICPILILSITKVADFVNFKGFYIVQQHVLPCILANIWVPLSTCAHLYFGTYSLLGHFNLFLTRQIPIGMCAVEEFACVYVPNLILEVKDNDASSYEKHISQKAKDTFKPNFRGTNKSEQLFDEGIPTH